MITYPRSLTAGDKVAIVSPASKISPDFVDGACATLESWGFRPVVGKHCNGASGSYSGTASERLADLSDAIADPDVRAILCSRGGYGTVHLLESLTAEMFRRDPKWIVGYSDISLLHAASVASGVASVHGPMAKCLTQRPDSESSQALRSILTGCLPDYTVAADPRSREGAAEAPIVGGNATVLTAIASSPLNLLRQGCILFIEDIDEAIYKVERMLYSLRLNGVLAKTKGLVVGQFTNYKASDDFQNMYDMVERIVADYDFPVAYGFPVGHEERNLPIIEGATARLTVEGGTARLSFLR